MNTHTLNALAYELELVLSDPDSKLSDEAERAISYTVAALRAQPTASVAPVAWIRKNGFRFNADIEPQDDNEIPLYAAPVAAQAPATNADALDALRQIAEWPDGGNRYGQENIKRFAQHAIDAMLKAREGER